MAAIGIIVGLIGAAVGITVGLVGGLAGAILGLLGATLGLLPHLFPIALITLGIIWLVKGSSARNVTVVQAGHGNTVQPQSPGNPR
jgi:ABC-type nitrate/sulfonate/bicarbonate transport system permease component